MLTDEQAIEIQNMKPTLSTAYILSVDKRWDERVRRIRNSGKDLSQMPLVPKATEYKNVRT